MNLYDFIEIRGLDGVKFILHSDRIEAIADYSGLSYGRPNSNTIIYTKGGAEFKTNEPLNVILEKIKNVKENQIDDNKEYLNENN